MAKEQMWEKEMREILRQKGADFQGSVGPYSEAIDDCKEILRIAESLDMPPRGKVGKIIEQTLMLISKELPPLTAGYTSFGIGMAYERFKNNGS